MYDGVLRDGLGLGLEKREARKVAEALEERRERVRGKEREREEVFGCLFSWEDNEREKWKKKKNKKKKTVFLQRAIAECREEERERELRECLVWGTVGDVRLGGYLYQAQEKHYKETNKRQNKKKYKK